MSSSWPEPSAEGSSTIEDEYCTESQSSSASPVSSENARKQNSVEIRVSAYGGEAVWGRAVGEGALAWGGQMPALVAA